MYDIWILVDSNAIRICTIKNNVWLEHAFATHVTRRDEKAPLEAPCLGLAAAEASYPYNIYRIGPSVVIVIKPGFSWHNNFR